MINSVTGVRIVLRAAPIILALLAILGGWHALRILQSPYLAYVRIIGVDRVEQETFQGGVGRPRVTVSIAYVICKPIGGSGAGSLCGLQDSDGQVVRWGQFNGDVGELVGTEFWADMSLSEPQPASSVALGLLVLVLAASVLIMISAAPIIVGGARDDEGSIKWRGDKWDVIVGGVITLCLLPFVSIVSSRTAPASVFYWTPLVVLIFSVAILLHAGASVIRSRIV